MRQTTNYMEILYRKLDRTFFPFFCHPLFIFMHFYNQNSVVNCISVLSIVQNWKQTIERLRHKLWTLSTARRFCAKQNVYIIVQQKCSQMNWSSGAWFLNTDLGIVSFVLLVSFFLCFSECFEIRCTVYSCTRHIVLATEIPSVHRCLYLYFFRVPWSILHLSMVLTQLQHLRGFAAAR